MPFGAGVRAERARWPINLALLGGPEHGEGYAKNFRLLHHSFDTCGRVRGFAGVVRVVAGVCADKSRRGKMHRYRSQAFIRRYIYIYNVYVCFCCALFSVCSCIRAQPFALAWLASWRRAGRTVCRRSHPTPAAWKKTRGGKSTKKGDSRRHDNPRQGRHLGKLTSLLQGCR